MLTRSLLSLIAIALYAPQVLAADPADYAVIVSRKTYADADWKHVCDTLVKKRNGVLLQFDDSINATLPELKRLFPRYTCIVATPAEANRQLVADVHRLTRRLDDDPYCDTFWGILTGFDAANAQRIADGGQPLVVKKLASATEIPLKRFEAGRWFSELKAGQLVEKKAGQDEAPVDSPSDSTGAMVDTLNTYAPDLFITSGHASERDWALGYSYPNGMFRSAGGKMTGIDTRKQKHAVNSTNPKVYLAVGNCLMGNIDGPDAMALAWMKSAGVNQMVGYTVLTWYGYAGWGVLDYYVEQPARYSLSEAFIASEDALVYRLNTNFPSIANAEVKPGSNYDGAIEMTDEAKKNSLTRQDAVGLLYDRDVVAFYGDPAWDARLADAPRAWDQNLTETDDVYTFDIHPNLGEQTFKDVSQNGSQRGGRPIIGFLPHRIGPAEVIEGKALSPVITDDFVLIPNPGSCKPGETYRVSFRAKPMK